MNVIILRLYTPARRYILRKHMISWGTKLLGYGNKIEWWNLTEKVKIYKILTNLSSPYLAYLGYLLG